MWLVANTSVSAKDLFYLLDNTAVENKWPNLGMPENNGRRHMKFPAQDNHVGSPNNSQWRQEILTAVAPPSKTF